MDWGKLRYPGRRGMVNVEKGEGVGANARDKIEFKVSGFMFTLGAEGWLMSTGGREYLPTPGKVRVGSGSGFSAGLSLGHLQGYLAHKKMPPPRTLLLAFS